MCFGGYAASIERRGEIIETLIAWTAPAATILAAMMTAANLGARLTGWGFVVFAVGSVAWSLVGLSTGQTNLLATNAFLTLVNLVGIWRWLGRQRAYEDGGKSAERASRRAASPTLFAATNIQGIAVISTEGVELGKAVEALIACETGQISYLVVGARRDGGLAEELRAVPRDAISLSGDQFMLSQNKAWFKALPILADGDWPVDAQAPVPADR